MSLKALQDLIEANPEALAKVKSAANHAEVSQIAKGYGIEVTPAEVIKYAAQQTAELDDDALEAVAGGAWGEDRNVPGAGGGGLPPGPVIIGPGGLPPLAIK